MMIDPLTGGVKFNEFKGRNPADIDSQETMEEVYNLNPFYCPVPSKLTARERYEKIKAVGIDCVKEDELEALVQENKFIYCYDGFEPSGRMHIAQGLMKAANVNELIDAGCIFIFWVADWFGLLNDKMGGDLNKIKVVGRYFVEVWKAVGMEMSNVKFLWCSNHIDRNSSNYWLQVIDIARKNTVDSVVGCSQILGRENKADLSAAQLMYPCMQAADIFYLKADICQLGNDQRKVNMLAREYCTKKKIEKKPVIISSVMIAGLLEGQYKMSKSSPDSAIFMEDSAEEVTRKIKKAFCPPGVSKENPCIDFTRYFIFKIFKKITIERNQENGGNKTYTDFTSFLEDYEAGLVHPGDLKPALSKGLNLLLEPVRLHFKYNTEAKSLLSTIKQYQQEAAKTK